MGIAGRIMSAVRAIWCSCAPFRSSFCVFASPIASDCMPPISLAVILAQVSAAINRWRESFSGGAFSISRHGHRWLESSTAGAVLIDDVLTTGSTVHECAGTLRRAGFCEVFVVTVMRG